MNNEEEEGIWKEAIVFSFEVLSLNYPGGAKEKHEKTQSG
jgi:hypothetical protein